MVSLNYLISMNLGRFLRAVSLVVGFSLPVTPAFAAEADLSWTDLSQEYDGQLKSPLVTTEPPNLEVTLEYFPRSNSEVLFQRIPEIDQPSYPSYGLNGKSDIGLGDLVDLEIDNQRLESVDVEMVNFAQAASWPQLAGDNPKGYFHPLTLTIYRVLGDDLFLVTEKTQDVLIPWRPATLDDGGEYPYGGRAFRARFNFTEEKFLAGNLALVISYNTNQGGPAPLGVAGPYDSLNVALNDDTPLVGSDDNPSRVIRQTASRIYQSGAFGKMAPMFVVRGFLASPATGQPIEAGGYLVRATVNDGDFTAEAYENFEITPQEVELDLLGVRQVADGSPKTIEVADIPEGSSVEVVFAKRDDLPVEEGLYSFFVRLSGGNFFGSRSGVMRLVAEEDTSPPVITLTGSALVTIEAGSEYADAGATATDAVDGAIAVAVDNKVNTQLPGSYLVSFTATDAAGNAAVEVARTVIVQDTLLPVITLTGSASVTIEAGAEYLDAGATATDTLDGAIAVVVDNKVNTQVPGSYLVSFTAMDAAGNAAVEVTRTVIVEDTSPPVITLIGSASVTIEAGAEYTDAGATAIDTLDGAIAVVVDNKVNAQVPGSYLVSFTATDAAGNAAVEVTRTVIVEDTSPPVITLTGSASVTIEAGAEYTDPGATASDTVDGAIQVEVDNKVNSQVPGSYLVSFTATDAAGNAAAEVTRAVIVEDTSPPVVTLIGSASVTIEAGSEYADAGATAFDTVDGTISVVVDNKVNAQVPGSYLVSFTATDAAGNAAVEVTRTVIVEETNTLPLVVTSISTAANGDVSLTWNSREGQTYAILAKDDLNESDISLWDEIDGSIESQGASTTAVISSEVVHSITDIGKIFFRVRKQR
ncbi:DUF5011 domain-containing protein [Akkermansiaceae bacterium]|nr:DUF5011 domain-containing protein [Akkermansiaceae bacterium]